MADGEVVAFCIASFVCALFVLEFGADKFIENTAVVAKRTGVPETIIALLTAGAEWEELAVVVFSIARHRSSLAIGNVVGSAISNILGAFSLGLLFHKPGPIVFDESSRLYSVLLLVLTGPISGLLCFGHHIVWRAVGGVTIGLFTAYVVSIAWAIGKGRIAAPELSDSKESDDSDADEPQRSRAAKTSAASRQPVDGVRGLGDSEALSATHQPLLGNGAPGPAQPRHNGSISSSSLATEAPRVSATTSARHSLTYHVALLVVGLVALLLSAYVISQAASTLATQFLMSDVLVGVIILSIATTLPEKFVAAVSGSRGHVGIMVANTVGSNIFLLTLCLGIIWVTTDGEMNQESVNPVEVGVMFGSTVWMTLTIWYGAKWARYSGSAMLVAYVAFIALEFTVIRPI